MAKSTGQKDLVFVSAAESSFATMQTPIGADAVFVNEAPEFKQAVPMLPDPERRDSYSQISQLRDKSDVGSFKIKTFFKASGTAGTPVQAGLRQCLTSMYGVETVNGGSNVIYSLMTTATALISNSLFWRVGDNMVLQHAGGIFKKMTVVITAKGNESIMSFQFEGQFAQQRRAGRGTTTTGSDTTHVIMNTGQGQFFDAGALITVGALTPNPVAITSISTDTFTVPTLSGSASAATAVAGYYPTATDSGYRIPGWRGYATLGGTNMPITKAEIVIENFHEILVDEKNDSDFASDVIPMSENRRSVTVTLEHYFDPTTAIGGANGWYNALNQVQQALVIPVGNVAGKIATFNFPIVELMDTPDLNSSTKVMFTRKYRALASSSLDDEHNLTLT